MTPNIINIFRMISAKLMHTADQHEVICIDPSHYNELRNVIFSAQNELELLRSEIETLKNQITAYQLTIANMESARDELMKQEPVGKTEVLRLRNGISEIIKTVKPLSNFDEYQVLAMSPTQLIDHVNKLLDHPLPAQQMLAEDKS